MKQQEREALATRLADKLETMALAGRKVANGFLGWYDEVEDNDRRAMAVFTLVEQSELEREHRDARYVWM